MSDHVCVRLACEVESRHGSDMTHEWNFSAPRREHYAQFSPGLLSCAVSKSVLLDSCIATFARFVYACVFCLQL